MGELAEVSAQAFHHGDFVVRAIDQGRIGQTFFMAVTWRLPGVSCGMTGVSCQPLSLKGTYQWAQDVLCVHVTVHSSAYVSIQM
jgi:hypothetical protein